MLGQLLTKHVRQLPDPFMTAESSPVYEDHYVLRCVAAEVLLEAALEAHLAAPLRYAPTTSRTNWNGAGRGGTMRGWGYPHLKLSRSPHSPRRLPALCLRQTTRRS